MTAVHPIFNPSTGPNVAYQPKTTDTSDNSVAGTCIPSVIVDSSALPSGASTGAKQDTGNISLASIVAALLATQSVDTVVKATAVDRGGLTGVKASSGAVTAGGTGHVTGDVLTNAAGTWTVTAASGVVTAVVPLVGSVFKGAADASGAPPSGALAQTATSGAGTGCTITATYSPTPVQLAPANANRRGFIGQNQSSAQIWLNGVAGATSDYHSLLYNSGDYSETPSQHAGTGAITIIGITYGQAFYAREF